MGTRRGQRSTSDSSRHKSPKPSLTNLTQTPDTPNSSRQKILARDQDSPPFPPIETSKTFRKSLPAEVDVEFAEDGDIKHLTRNSVGTATLVYYDFPLLETEARGAMEEAQQLREMKKPQSVEGLRKYRLVNKWADPKDKQDLLNSHPGCPEPRKWAISAMAKRLQKNEETIKRYARGIGARVAGTFHHKK